MEIFCALECFYVQVSCSHDAHQHHEPEFVRRCLPWPYLPFSVCLLPALNIHESTKHFCALFIVALIASTVVLTVEQHRHHWTHGGDVNAVLEKLGAAPRLRVVTFNELKTRPRAGNPLCRKRISLISPDCVTQSFLKETTP